MISGEQIRTARERARLKQSDLAVLLGVTERTVSNWETGKHVPVRRETQLLEILQIDPAGPPERVTLLGATDEQLLSELSRRLLGRSVSVVPEQSVSGSRLSSHDSEEEHHAGPVAQRHLRLAADRGQENIAPGDLPHES
ncbi:helix-turn-helix domain-containing protein [Arthrobacter sp. NPDC090010]|uniref:helix-turn-helix domain-containing protein n=1 Tax=Arthrobacter sp. NPDC090010 TaxID=3363942 RepID=UPI003804BFE8